MISLACQQINIQGRVVSSFCPQFGLYRDNKILAWQTEMMLQLS